MTGLLIVLAAASLGVAAAASLVVRGAVTLDLGIGRRWTELRPFELSVAAPPVAVFPLLALPYVSANPPRELREKVTVLERDGGMMLAAHRTRVGPVTTTTVETVVLDEPRSIAFRLVRGPVPDAVERIELRDDPEGTRMVYTGALATDLWLVGRVWGWLVARRWRRAVCESMKAARDAAERSAERAARRAAA